MMFRTMMTKNDSVSIPILAVMLIIFSSVLISIALIVFIAEDNNITKETEQIISEVTITKQEKESHSASRVYELSSKGVVSISVYNQDNVIVGTGSGFIFDTEGHIVTNNHVIDTGTSYIITFLDGAMKRGELIGNDPLGDLAVLLVSELPPSAIELKLTNSMEIKIGEPVYALGSPAGFVGSITSGVVSQANRTGISILPMIQTDAPINPGNSGGPLLNEKGQVLGINTIKFIEDNTGQTFEGLGFAIPSSIANRIITGIISNGEYKHPFIGISGVFLDPLQIEINELPPSVESGYLIKEIIEGTAASNNDFQVGDIIVKLDGFSVKQLHDIPYIMEHFLSPEQEVELEILRDEKEIKIMINLGERPIN